MKKLLISLFAVGLIFMPATAAKWVSADRVKTFCSKIV